MILVDTDHFSVLADARHRSHTLLTARLESSTENLALPVISVEEQLRGWLAQIRRLTNVEKQIYPYDRLIRLLETLAQWDVCRWSEPASKEFTRLRKQRVRIGTQDLKIASIALANDALLLSANLRDFQQVPGLKVGSWLSG